MLPDHSVGLDDAALRLVEIALAEDIGPGDLSGECFLPAGATSRALIVAREELVLAGGEVVRRVFEAVDPALRLEILSADGALLDAGDVFLRIEGSTRSIVAAERTALNFLQQLSGVATMTRHFVKAVAHTAAQILDTRKTLPGWRSLQKAAVRAGGGVNHRFGLYDMVMLKDNHLAAISSGGASVTAVRHALADKVRQFRLSHPGIRVEVEADTVEQALEWFQIPGVDVVLLDNMTVDELCICVAARPAGFLLEASGGISLSTASAIAETGVDFLSIGALTHSAPAVDLGLDFLP